MIDRSIQIKAMASEQRLLILELLAHPQENFGHQWSADASSFGVCMTLIAEALSVTQPTISRHIEILNQAGFIKIKKHLKWKYCERNNDQIKEYLDWLANKLN